MKATISVDHRVSDGADIVPFRVSRAAEGASAGRVPGKSSQNVGVRKVIFRVLQELGSFSNA